MDQGCDLARETQGKGRVWVWTKLTEKTQLTLQMPHTVLFFKGSECQKTPAGPCSHASIFFQSNGFGSRDDAAVVFQTRFVPFGHHPVIPGGLNKLTHLKELLWMHFIWVVPCHKTLSIEKCGMGDKKLKGGSNYFPGKREAWL